MNLFPSFADAGQCLSQREKEQYYTALIEYLFYDKEPNLTGAAKAVMIGIRPILDKSKAKAKAGSKGGKASSKKQANDKQNASTGETCSVKNEVSKEEAIKITSTITSNYPNSLNDLPNTSTFPYECLGILNEETGHTFSELPNKCFNLLQRMEGRYTHDDVRAMVRYKADEWQGTRFAVNLTPQTLFSPDHFEQYVVQSKTSKSSQEVVLDAELERLAANL